MADDITGEVAIVTGASRGLGLALARELGRRSARLVMCARDPQELDRAAGDLRAGGAEVTAAVFPGLTVRVLHGFAVALPQPAPGSGGGRDGIARGSQLRPAIPAWVFDRVTALGRSAARRLNETPDEQ